MVIVSLNWPSLMFLRGQLVILWTHKKKRKTGKFILFHRKSFFRLQRCLGNTWGYGSMILCCKYYVRCFCPVSSSPYLKMSYFTSRDENSSEHKLERKRYDILYRPRDIYMNIGHKSAANQSRLVAKRY